MRVRREAILISVLSQIVRATSDRMAREALITFANRAANLARLEEIGLPGDFMSGSKSYISKKPF